MNIKSDFAACKNFHAIFHIFVEHPLHMLLSPLPIRLPDETLYSLVARIVWMNGLNNSRESCAFLFGNLNEARVGDAHVDIEQFGAATRHVYGQRDALMDFTTTLPFFRRLGTYPGLASAHEQDVQSNAADTAQGGLGLAALSNGYAHIWRYCPVCNEEDVREHGSTYWHRSHQLPGVFVCTKHRRSLLEVNLPYRMRQQHFISPSRMPDQLELRESCQSSAGTDLALKLALFSENILHDTSQGNSESVIQGAILDGLAARGLLSKGRQISKKEFVEGLATCFSSISGNESIRPLVNEQNLIRLANTLKEPTQVRPALLNLILIYWLFGSWGLFLEYCAWWKSLNGPESAPRTQGGLPSGIEATGGKRSHRDVCINFLQHHPNATRSDFWREHPKSCRWLAQRESNWLDQHLPISVLSRGSQLQLF